jgi:hypothetical protein
MRQAALRVAVVLLLCCGVSAQVKIEGVSEPPELSGEAKKVTKPSDADTELFELIGHLKNEDETEFTLPKLDDFITRHPDYSDALFLRAYCKACILNDHGFTSIQSDVEAAMSRVGQVQVECTAAVKSLRFASIASNDANRGSSPAGLRSWRMIAGNSSWMYAKGLLSPAVGMASVRSGSLKRWLRSV